MDQTLKETKLDEETEKMLLDEYKTNNKLESKNAYEQHLKDRHIDEELLMKALRRPHLVIKYREERWGVHARSIYLKNKERFDLVKYQRLEASNMEIIQEIYFRIKDGEVSWDEMARQFPGAGEMATALRGPEPIVNLEQPIQDVLRKSPPGKIARPIQLEDRSVVVALEKFEPGCFDEKVRTELLRQAFDDWIQQECIRLTKRIRFPE